MTEVTEKVERVQVAEIHSEVNELKDKFKPNYWKSKDKEGNTQFLLMDEMELSHKLKALAFAERQATKYAKLQEIHMNKYEELLTSLQNINNLSEEEALDSIKQLVK